MQAPFQPTHSTVFPYIGKYGMRKPYKEYGFQVKEKWTHQPREVMPLFHPILSEEKN